MPDTAHMQIEELGHAINKGLEFWSLQVVADGAILLSKELSAEESTALGVTARSKLRFVRPAMLPYLKRHRDLFLKKQISRGTGAN